jgi:5-methylcytosine-specific restriction protein A
VADRLHLSTTFAGRGVGDFEYGAESMAILSAAISAAMTRDDEGEPARSPATRRADALIDIAKYFVDHRDEVPGRRNRPHVNIVIEAKDLAEGGSGIVVESGDILPRSSVEAFLCDSSLSRVLKSGSTLLDYGTATRTIANGLWSALVIRDRHCRFPGCDRPATWCDGHHVRWFSQGGATALDNLVLLCRRHHRILHKPGWSARLCPDASLEVTDPWGAVRVSHPPWWVPRLELA